MAGAEEGKVLFAPGARIGIGALRLDAPRVGRRLDADKEGPFRVEIETDRLQDEEPEIRGEILRLVVRPRL